jgi:non-heme Fe2+,alpha-ketoglutarate-dependent halogenase
METISHQLANHHLSDAEVEAFKVNGYAGPFKIYESEEMDSIWKTVRRQLLDRQFAIYPESSGGNLANYDRHLDVDLLARHVCNARIADRVTSLIGPDVLCWRTEFFPKYAGDEGTDWHQADTFANASGTPQLLWPADGDALIRGGTLTVWTAFTDATLQNGCLQLIPGSHVSMNYDETLPMEYQPDKINNVVKNGVSRGFFGYDYRQLQKDPDFKPDESNAMSVVMKKGECIIFLSTLMHASLPHTGPRTDYRMGFAARYVPTSVKIYPEANDVSEYGGEVSLDSYGAVLISGNDNVCINKIVSANRRGTPFTKR